MLELELLTEYPNTPLQQLHKIIQPSKKLQQVTHCTIACTLYILHFWQFEKVSTNFYSNVKHWIGIMNKYDIWNIM